MLKKVYTEQKCTNKQPLTCPHKTAKSGIICYKLGIFGFILASAVLTLTAYEKKDHLFTEMLRSFKSLCRTCAIERDLRPRANQ